MTNKESTAEAQPLIVDLAEFSRAIRNRPAGRDLGDAVIKLNDACVVERGLQHADLLLAEINNYADHIHSRDDTTDDEAYGLGAVGGALFAQAIIVYTRVTHGSTTLTYRLTRSDMTAEQAEVHDRILILRNQVVAHYVHKAKHAQGAWDKQFVLFVPQHSVAPIRTAFLGTNWRQLDVAALTQLVGDLLIIAEWRRKQAFDDAYVALRTFLANNPGGLAELSRYAADLSGFSQEIVTTILTDPPPQPEVLKHRFLPGGGMRNPD